MAIDTIKSTAVLDGAITNDDLANDIAINTSGAITTTGAFTSQGIDDNSNATAITIDSSENVLITKTATGISTIGSELKSTGELLATVNNDACAFLNRKSSDGDIINLRKDGSTVGNIGAFGSAGVYIAAPTSGGSALVFNDNAPILYPAKNNSGTIAVADNAIDLGASGVRFKDAYLSGGVYLGGTGAVNKLDDYEEGTWTPILRGSTGSPSGQSYSQQTGTYTKVGRKVHLQAYISVANIGTGMNGTYAYIAGFPFAVSSGNSNYSTGSFSYLHQLGQNVNSLHAYGNQGTDFAYVVYQNGAGTTSAYLSPAGWGSTPSVMFGMTYFTPA